MISFSLQGKEKTIVGGTSKEKRAKILELVTREIGVVTRSLEYSEKPEELQMRLLNLYSEKILLMRESENERFLTNKEGKPQGEFFKESQQLYQQSLKKSLEYLQKHPKFKGMDKFYYQLALNNRDFSDGKREQEFYLKALEHSKNNELMLTIKSSLADSYYNQKKFDQAIYYYEQLVKEEDREWWTKSAYNLSWCYLKTKKFDQAKTLLNLVYQRSSSGKYISFKEQALNDMGLFFAYSHTKDEGIKWYQENTDEAAKYIAQMSKFYAGRSNFEEAEKVLLKSLKMATGETQLPIYVQLLKLYEKSNKWDDHFSLAKKIEGLLPKNPDPILLGQYGDSIKASIGFYQEEIQHKGATQTLVDHIKDSLVILINKFPDERKDNYYNMGSHLDFVGQFDGAYDFYYRSITQEQGKSNLTIDQLYKPILSLLEKNCSNISDCAKKKENIYNLYLAEAKEGEFRKDVSISLVQVYIDQRNMPLSEKSLEEFKKSFPTEATIYNNFVNQFLDIYSQNKNIAALEKWGGLVQNQEQLEGIQNQVSNLKFNSIVDGISKEGLNPEVINKFKNLYQSPNTTKAVKKDSAFNIAMMTLSQDKISESLSWSDSALNLMTKEEVQVKSNEYNALVNKLLMHGHFTQAKDLIERLKPSLCERPDMLNFDNFFYIAYFEWGVQKSLQTLNDLASCIEYSKYEGYRNSILSNIGYFEGAETVLKYKSSYKDLQQFSNSLFEAYFRKGDIDEKKLLPYLSYTSPDIQERWAAQKNASTFEPEVKLFTKKRFGGYIVNGLFKEDQFKYAFENYMGSFSNLDQKGREIAQNFEGHKRMKTIQVLQRAYNHFIKELQDVQVPGMPPQYVQAVKNEVQNVIQQAGLERDNLTKEIQELQKSRSTASQKTYFSKRLDRLPVRAGSLK